MEKLPKLPSLGCVFATAASCTGCCVLLGFTRGTAETVASARSIVAISNAVRFFMAHYHYHYHYIEFGLCSGMELECPKCHHKWDYKGNLKLATCPNCMTKVKVPGVKRMKCSVIGCNETAEYEADDKGPICSHHLELYFFKRFKGFAACS